MKKLIILCIAFAFLSSNAESSVSGWNPETGTYNVDPSGSILKITKEPKHQLMSEKMYVAFEEVDSNEDAFHIHIGGNMWIETDCIHRDATGFYTFESEIELNPQAEYVKKWRCPFCNSYWPIGVACKNPDCPSKYKG